MTPTSQPYLTLVDDDFHSARLLIRTLLAHGAPSVSWLAEPEPALAQLTTLATTPDATPPGLVIVDLKASSSATTVFIEALTAATGGDLTTIAMATTLDRQPREELLAAGAAAVFERHSDIALYREEAANIVSFWDRCQR